MVAPAWPKPASNSPMKKPRSDSKLLNLPEDQLGWLCDQLLSGLPQHKVRALLEKEHGITTSNAALSRFYDAVCVPALLDRRRRAAGTANTMAEDAKQRPGEFTPAILDTLNSLVLTLSNSTNPDPEAIRDLYTLVLKAQKQQLSADQLKLLREKFEFDAAKAALAHLADLREIQRDGKLDDDAKLLAVRKRLFGEVPA